MAAKASLDVPLRTWGRVRPGRTPACSRKPPAHSAALRATREPKPAGSALAPQWDREVPALGLVSMSLPVFLLHSLKTKLILASGSLSFIPDCCSPQPYPCIFSVCWKALFAHAQHQCIFPFGNRESSTQHQASLFPRTQNLLLPLGPHGLCDTFTGCWGRELSHGASQQEATVQASRFCGGIPCLFLVSQLPNGWQIMTPYTRKGSPSRTMGSRMQ